MDEKVAFGACNTNANHYHRSMHADMPKAEQSSASPEANGQTRTAAPSPIRSRELFGAGRQLLIEHSGHVYLLRITQNNKLILTK